MYPGIEISVIIPVYNVERYLERCIKSIKNQQGITLQIILVDDGSTDKSGVLCDTFACDDERITVIHKKNGGLASARNAGLDIAKGKYIYFVDSDDYIVDNSLKYLYSLAEKYDAQLISCALVASESMEPISVAQKLPLCENLYNTYELMKEYVSGSRIKSLACTKLFDRKIFEKVRFEKVRAHEDSYIMHLLFGQVGKAVSTNYIGYVYYQSNGSLTRSRFNRERLTYITSGERLVEYIYDNYKELYGYALFRLVIRQLETIHIIYNELLVKEFKQDIVKTEKKLLQEVIQLEPYQVLNQSLYNKLRKYCRYKRWYHIRYFCFGLFLKIKGAIK